MCRDWRRLVQSHRCGRDFSAAYYTRHYEHFEWPEGASGPTIGIGFDCGYVTSAQARVDWEGFVDQKTIDAILPACGLRGEAAASWVRRYGGSVTITWDQAIAQFRAREVPQWEAKCRADLPNFDDLPPDCRGVLVSVAYNRGASFDLPGPRYAEMRSIKAHMIAKNFAAIPADIISMQRLWPKGGDLWKRRAHEAALFESALKAPAVVASVPPPPAPPPAPPPKVIVQPTLWQRLLSRL